MAHYSQLELSFPPDLRECLSNAVLTKNTVGYSGAFVFHIDRMEGRPAYLKTVPSVWHQSLQQEADALNWLQGKVPVPEVLYFGQYEGRDYLVMSEVKGKDGSQEELLAQPEELVRIYAEAVKELHRLPAADCPLDQSLERKLAAAARAVAEGIVNGAEFEATNAGRSPADILGELARTRPAEDPVFTHGDYCLPNLMIHNGRLSGFIDVGRAGVAERYQDIAIAIRSLRYNFGSDRYKSLFTECYGIQDLDGDKVDYYILLDELF
jgi:aminoglycoside phosphotransferase